MRSMLYGVPPTDVSTYVPLAALMLLVAAGAGLAPAWRAVRHDPLSSLRSE
jgi:ABC-type lipoprotein release transport system permease subunit